MDTENWSAECQLRGFSGPLTVIAAEQREQFSFHVKDGRVVLRYDPHAAVAHDGRRSDSPAWLAGLARVDRVQVAVLALWAAVAAAVALYMWINAGVYVRMLN